LLLVAIMAVLVATDAYRDEFALLAAQLKGLLPDAELVARLETGRAGLQAFADRRAARTVRELRDATMGSTATVDARIAELADEIAQRTQRRRSSVQRTLSLLNGEGFQDDIRNEIEIELLTAERDALRRLRSHLAERQPSIRDAASRFLEARERTLATWRAYLAKQRALEEFQDANGLRTWVPGTRAWRRAAQLRRDVTRAFEQYATAGRDFYASRDRWRKRREAMQSDIARIQAAAGTPFEPLDDLIATRQTALASADRQAQRIRDSAARVFLDAVWILVLVTLAPVAIKAFWYWIMAPLASRRPPIRLEPRKHAEPGAATAAPVAMPAGSGPSALSQELAIGNDEELLVHPNFLQSSTDRGAKNTKWLLSWTYPFTSLAAGMAVLTRVRATSGDPVVVSSTNDPFSEVGVIELPEAGSLVLQPRSLVGIIQPIGNPVRIRRRWLFGLSAWITFQFRYLIFDGPAKLILQGRRGIRVERAGSGRSIDQRATIGFSPTLDYSPRRSETFGAYLLGMRGLFNDNFSGGQGIYVYEEMPYFGSTSGITGRGLEGLTDGVLKAFGI
jgi:hypothetical protein